MIPETAYEAAAKATYEVGPGYELTGHKPWEELSNTSRANATRNATAAIEAALPHIEAALRKQIAADLRAKGNTYPTHSERRGAWHSAARIAQEGAFHCCAHPKCPGGSICCCPDAEEGNTK